ncbi:MAG: GMC family oxidoreductase [Marinovum sp.]|nr:GMC family oxidoreductase [Marinovum sp.]
MTDFFVIGGGSAGCVLAAELARCEAGSVMVIEACPSERYPLVSMPFGLVWLMGSERNWSRKAMPQAQAGGRQIAVPRGRMLGASGSIKSMVWFRGRRSDFDSWNIPGWSFNNVEPAFEAVEVKLKPTRMRGAQPLTKGLAPMSGAKSQAIPTPEGESAGAGAHNMDTGRRNAAAGVVLTDGTELRAAKGIVLDAGSLASPAILMRSGVGPANDIKSHGVQTRIGAPEVGANLNDHPGVGLHFEATASGYGLVLRQWLNWAVGPFRYVGMGQGRLASPTVEGASFFNARGECAERDVQSLFIPFHLDWRGAEFLTEDAA